MSTEWHGESGMTLIELLVAILILGIIIAPLTMVLVFGLGATKATVVRTSDSSGAQLLTSYLVTDVHSADVVWTPEHPTPLGVRCGNADTRLELQWTRADDPTQRVAVTYDGVTPTDPTRDTPLVRRVWAAGAASCTVRDSTTLLPALDPAHLPLAECLATSGPAPDCGHADAVTLTVSALSDNARGALYPTAYTFSLTAARRVG